MDILLVYAWLALQITLNRPLIVVGALGKAGFFLLTVAFAIAGEVPRSMSMNATPDLVLACVFLWWARGAAEHRRIEGGARHESDTDNS